MTKPKLTKAQEKRFDKYFRLMLPLMPMYPNRNIPFEVKHFLAKELSKQKKEIIEELEKKIVKHIETREGGQFIRGFREAIKTIKKI